MQLDVVPRLWVVGLALVAAALLGGAIVSGQSPADVHRFFGFQSDISIDGEPIDDGTVIVAMRGDEEIGRTVITAAGVWVIDVDAALIESEPCPVSFVVGGIHVDPEWKDCPFRVSLALTSTVEETVDEESDVMEEEQPEADHAGDEDAQVSATPSEQAPSPPRTGTGGLLGHQQTTNWPQAAALTSALMVVISLAAWLMSRRSDSAR